MTFIFLTLACIHVNIEQLLLFLHQDPLISSLAAEYIFHFLPGLYCDYLFMTLSRYLTSQNLVKPMMIAACAGTFFTILTQPAVYRLGLGLRASACFLSCSYAVMLFCEVLYIFVYRIYSETWAGWDFVAALSDWGIFFKLGIPGVLMIAFEEWCLEISTFVAGTIGDAVLGAQAIVFQIQSFLYMIPLGICTAVNVRIGQGLGAFDPHRARHTYMTALVSVIGIVFSTAVPVVLLRYRLPYLFTTDGEVVAEAVKLFPMLLIFQFCEGLGGVSEAVLLACGRQFLGAITIFFGYYVVGLPLGFLLTYKLEFGIIGMWMGLATGFFLTDCAYTCYALRTDWMEQSRRAVNNVNINCEGLRNDYREPEVLLLDYERGEEARSLPPTLSMRRPNYFKIRLRISFFIFLLLFLFCNLMHRLYHSTPYWTLSEIVPCIPQHMLTMAADDYTTSSKFYGWAFLYFGEIEMKPNKLNDEELQHLVMIAPPGIFEIVFSPSSSATKVELERVTLLLLLAAIKCKKREQYIRNIMENLNTETQKGIMESITSLTELPDTTVSLTGPYELSSELRCSVRKALSSRVELYFLLAEEVLHRICDHQPNWSPSRALSSTEHEKRVEKAYDNKIARSRSLASSLDLIGVAFKQPNEERLDISKSPQSIETDTAATSETGYESRPPTDKTMRGRLESVEHRGLDIVLGIMESQIVDDCDEKREIVEEVSKAKVKLRQQSLIISEQADQLEEAQSQLAEVRAEADRLRTERARLADAAASARHWRDEADAGQQAIIQLRESERTCEKLKQNLEAALYYRIRCQELSEEVESLIKERDDLDNRLSEQQDEQSKIRALDEKLVEKTQRILELESQRKKDLDEICRLKNEVTETRIDALNASRKDLTSFPFSDDDDEVLCRLPSLQSETSSSELILVHPTRTEACQTQEIYSENAVEIQKELEQTVERCASHLERIRSKLDSVSGKEKPGQAIIQTNKDHDNIGCRVECLMIDLEQTILDIINTIEENDRKLLDLERVCQEKSSTRPVVTQTEDDFQLLDKTAFKKSSADLKTNMLSAQSTFQDSVESLREILTDAMHKDLMANIDRVVDHIGQKHTVLSPPSPTLKSDQAVKCIQTCLYTTKDAHCQTSAEYQSDPTSNRVQRPYRICNQFGTPLQLSVIQPSRIQQSDSKRGRENGSTPKKTTVTHLSVNTPSMVGKMTSGSNEAVREALLQVSEAKSRIASLTRERDDLNELLNSTQLELTHCRDFLKEYEKRNAYLEKENRTLLLQLRSLLSQNQGVVTEALENNESHYRENLALRDELESIKRYKERLEEKVLEHYKTMSSPKKIKPTIGFLQKARDALIKDRDVYKLDNIQFAADGSIEPDSDIKQVTLLSAPRKIEGHIDEVDDGYLKDFQNFIRNLEKRQLNFSPTGNPVPSCDSKPPSRASSISSAPLPRRCLSEQQPRNVRCGSSTDSECTDNSNLSLRLPSSPHFPVTDRSEEDHIEAYTPNSVVPSHRKALVGKTNSITVLPTPNRTLLVDTRPIGDANLKKTQSLSVHRRRLPSANENSVVSSLGGLIGRRKFTSLDSNHVDPVTSFGQSRTGTLTRKQQESPTSMKLKTESAQSADNSDCVAKPVVFLEYGDL
ncbi:hypothetical protein Aperf_G00000035350 [Anoplocephala perfoliata]